MTDGEVTPEFLTASTRAAIRALRSLEQTAIMLETHGPDCFPPPNEQGQIHFGLVLMQAAAQAIRTSWSQAIADIEDWQAFADTVDPWARIGRLQRALKPFADCMVNPYNSEGFCDAMDALGEAEFDAAFDAMAIDK